MSESSRSGSSRIIEETIEVLREHRSVAPLAGHIAGHCICGVDTSNLAKHQASMLARRNLLVRPESEADSILQDHRLVATHDVENVCACGATVHPDAFYDHVIHDLAASRVLVG
jgi:hypothetical protein